MGDKVFELLRGDGTHYSWLAWCPACDAAHSFADQWSFDGDRERPTFSPSMLVNVEGGNPTVPICHSYLTAGVWNYLPDCTHAMAGQQVPAPDWADTRWGRMRPDGVVPAPR